MTFAVIWCDSPRGLISYTCVPPSNKPTVHAAVPDNATYVNDKDELFDILVKRDGTIVAFPYNLLYDYLGWTVNA
jgi:hypothetical protein